MEVKRINKSKAIIFIHNYHYSKILPRLTKEYLGVFEEGVLIGVITLGWGTQPLQTINKIFKKHDLKSSDYYEIGKMCFLPRVNNSNYGSRIMSVLVKWVKKNTSTIFLYTLADGIMGKCGYVYQASNFMHIGKFKTSIYFDNNTGEKIHPRSSKQLCIENAKRDGKKKVFWLTHDFCKYKNIDKINGLMFRYIYPLNKNAKNILKDYPEYSGNSNPKDKDLIFEKRVSLGKFEKINKPDFNMNVFNHNYQKYNTNELNLFSA
tara:strand:+ start:160 stop:948 length:789 start_codon:yes stop_codon:yes gene_type:complete